MIGFIINYKGGHMNALLIQDITSKNFIALIGLILILLLTVSATIAHGPKGHAGSEFTALQAVKNGIAMYDKLVVSGNLSEPWETDLTDIEVLSRQRDKNVEFVVKFSRSKGEPQSVYIYFTEEGEYSGSNYTGN
jgi:hypothetical protein